MFIMVNRINKMADIVQQCGNFQQQFTFFVKVMQLMGLVKQPAGKI